MLSLFGTEMRAQLYKEIFVTLFGSIAIITLFAVHMTTAIDHITYSALSTNWALICTPARCPVAA